jgi:hypothetical protein
MGKELEFHLNIISDDYNFFDIFFLHSLQSPPCANKWLVNLKLHHEFSNHVKKLFILRDGKISFTRKNCAKVPNVNIHILKERGDFDTCLLSFCCLDTMYHSRFYLLCFVCVTITVVVNAHVIT